MWIQKAFSGFLVTVTLSLLSSAAAQESDSDAAQPKERRISVVHAQFGNNCAGYLYVSQVSLRYKVLAPANYRNHSFQIQRSEITALQPWVVMGQQQNVTEIKTAHATYHFWVLPKGTDPVAARGQNLNTIAAPAEKLIAAIRDPESGLNQSASKPTASDDDGGTASSTNGHADSESPGARGKTSGKRGQPSDGDSTSASSS